MNIICDIWLIIAYTQLFFWAIIFSRIFFWKRKDIDIHEFPGVSVIITAKDEAENLVRYLPKILEQDYAKFELIVVDDGSRDNSKVKLDQLKNQYNNLHVISLEDNIGKKGALGIGLANAKYDWFLFTDADCCPKSDKWIKGMIQTALSEGKDIVLGYGPMIEKKGMLNKWIQLETKYTAIQYLSMCLWGKAYMGVGRNLLYSRKIYKESESLNKYKDVKSGDDDLMINEMSNRQNTGIQMDSSTFMFSEGETSLIKYYRQKIRHFSTGTHYKFIDKTILSLISFSHAVYCLGLIIIIFKNIWLIDIIVIIIGRFLVQLGLFMRFMLFERQYKIMSHIIFFDMMLLLYYIVFAKNIIKPGFVDKWK